MDSDADNSTLLSWTKHSLNTQYIIISTIILRDRQVGAHTREERKKRNGIRTGYQ